MPHKWVIQRKPDDKMDLYCREFMNDSSKLAYKRFFGLLETDFDKDVAKAALMLETEAIKCNRGEQSLNIGFCLNYIASYGNPGDLIFDENVVYVVLDKALA